MAEPEIGEPDQAAWVEGVEWVVGLDEAGRGPLAGPVTVGFVALRRQDVTWVAGVNDSKTLSARQRDRLRRLIELRAACFGVVHVEASEIDRLNILRASLEGMRLASERAAQEILARGGITEIRLLVDGNQRVPGAPVAQQVLVGGDRRSWAIAAASILAKEARDARMNALHAEYPAYGFDRHAGYPTRDHLLALERHGPCPEHRRTYAPVRRAELSLRVF